MYSHFLTIFANHCQCIYQGFYRIMWNMETKTLRDWFPFLIYVSFYSIFSYVFMLGEQRSNKEIFKSVNYSWYRHSYMLRLVKQSIEHYVKNCFSFRKTQLCQYMIESTTDFHDHHITCWLFNDETHNRNFLWFSYINYDDNTYVSLALFKSCGVCVWRLPMLSMIT